MDHYGLRSEQVTAVRSAYRPASNPSGRMHANEYGLHGLSFGNTCCGGHARAPQEPGIRHRGILAIARAARRRWPWSLSAWTAGARSPPRSAKTVGRRRSAAPGIYPAVRNAGAVFGRALSRTRLVRGLRRPRWKPGVRRAGDVSRRAPPEVVATRGSWWSRSTPARSQPLRSLLEDDALHQACGRRLEQARKFTGGSAPSDTSDLTKRYRVADGRSA